MLVASHCPLCGSGRSLDYYRFGAPNRIGVANRICEECGLVFQSPRPDAMELKEYYARYAQVSQPEVAQIPTWFEEHIGGIARLRLRYLKRFLRQGDRVLDIGCSFGAMLDVLRRESGLALELVGVNPEPAFARFAQQRYGLDVRATMFEEQNFAPASFDVVLLDNVIEHFDDPKATVRRIRELLAPGGRLFVATNNLYEPHGFFWQNFFPEHTVTFSPRTLAALLESEGFRMLDTDTAGHVTYAGYRYPYLQCVAEKDENSQQYDFRSRGDKAAEMLDRAKAYQNSFYAKEGLAKRIYELSLQQPQTRAMRARITCMRLLARILGRPWQHVPQGHTLPPEEFFVRRLAIVFCSQDEDIAMARSVVRDSGLRPLTFLLRREKVTKYFEVVEAPAVATRRKPPARSVDGSDLLEWALDEFPKVDELLIARFQMAETAGTSFETTHREFHESGVEQKAIVVPQPEAAASYSVARIAQWTFFRGGVVPSLRGTNLLKSLELVIQPPKITPRMAKALKQQQEAAVSK
jgi:2-polyprenyl-3-methyl-5-hydroxy-6-metoxy-1,4-benzoquinol methylase